MNTPLEKSIVPNLPKAYIKAKAKRNLAIICLPLCFVMFGVGGFLMTVNPLCFPVLIVGFLGFPSSIFSLVFFSARMSNMNSLITMSDLISQRDKVFFPNLYCFGFSSDLLVSNAINKLVQTGNLKGYKVVADVVVVKDSVYLSEEDAVREYKEMRFGNANITNTPTSSMDDGSGECECYYCHAQ